MSEEVIQDTGSQETVAAEVAPVSFHESLAEDLRNEPSLRNFTDANSLAKSYVHAQRMIGADKIALPGKHATPDEWRNVYTKLGAPESADGYDFTKIEGLNDTVANSLRQKAYEAGLTVNQANQLATAEEARQAGIEELQKEYGKAFDQRLELAQTAARTFLGGTELFDSIELADGRLLGDVPEIVKMFASLGEQIGEDKLVGEPTELVMTPEEAQRQIDELTLPTSPYWDKNHPNKDKIVDEVLRLREYL
jgi:hypothetical protein